jgi:hypothetical protein
VAMSLVQVLVGHGTAQTLLRQRFLILSVMFALIPISCASERTNAPTNIYQCKTVRQCEATING